MFIRIRDYVDEERCKKAQRDAMIADRVQYGIYLGIPWDTITCYKTIEISDESASLIHEEVFS